MRTLWLRIHQWIGLGLFVLLVPLAASGALTALRPTLDDLAHPERRPVAKAPAIPSFSAYQATAAAAFGPGATVTDITLKPGQAVIAHGLMRHSINENAPDERGPPVRLTAWIDPGGARLLAVEQRRGRGEDLMAKAHAFHETLLLGRIGRRTVGVLGVFLLAQALTGVLVWWPRMTPLWFGLRWRRTTSSLTNLHYLIGFWTSIPLAFLALTGIGLSFPQVTVVAISQVAPVQRLRPPGRTLFASRLSADQAVTLALAGESGAHIQSLEEPTDSSPSWKFQVVGGGHGPVRLGVNDDTGEVRAIGEKRSSPGNVMQRMIKQLHSGDGDGRRWALWRWIAILAGFMPVFLALTGVIAFGARQVRRA